MIRNVFLSDPLSGIFSIPDLVVRKDLEPGSRYAPLAWLKFNTYRYQITPPLG
jgi:hypothetical protein